MKHMAKVVKSDGTEHELSDEDLERMTQLTSAINPPIEALQKAAGSLSPKIGHMVIVFHDGYGRLGTVCGTDYMQAGEPDIDIMLKALDEASAFFASMKVKS